MASRRKSDADALKRSSSRGDADSTSLKGDEEKKEKKKLAGRLFGSLRFKKGISESALDTSTSQSAPNSPSKTTTTATTTTSGSIQTESGPSTANNKSEDGLSIEEVVEGFLKEIDTLTVQEQQAMEVRKDVEMRLIKALSSLTSQIHTDKLSEQEVAAKKELIQKAKLKLKESRMGKGDGGDFLNALLDRAEQAERKEKEGLKKIAALEKQLIQHLKERTIQQSSEDINNQQLKKKLSELELHNTNLETSLREKEQKILELSDNKQMYEQQLLKLKSEVTDLQTKLSTAKMSQAKGSAPSGKNQQVESLLRENESLMKRYNELQNEVMDWKSKYEIEHDTLNGLIIQRVDLEERLDAERQSKEDALKRVSEVKEEMEVKLKQVEEKYQQQIKELEDQLNKLKETQPVKVTPQSPQKESEDLSSLKRIPSSKSTSSIKDIDEAKWQADLEERRRRREELRKQREEMQKREEEAAEKRRQARRERLQRLLT